MPEAELPNLPHEIAAPEDYLPGTPLWVWLVLGGLILALLIGLVFIIRSLSKSSAKNSLIYSKSIFQQANEQLVGLTEKAATMPLALFATSTSLILRDCLSKALSDPALYETDEELAIRSASLDSVPDSMRQILLKLAGAKYAPSFTDEKQAMDFAKNAQDALREFQSEKNRTREDAS